MPRLLRAVPNVPLMDVADRGVTTVFPAPWAPVVIGDITKTVDGIGKNLFVEVPASVGDISTLF